MSSKGPFPIVIAGCSRRKMPAGAPGPALDLYQGGCIPALRACAEAKPGLRSRIWILSAQHGLLHAETLVLPYDRRMEPVRAAQLCPAVGHCLQAECDRNGMPPEVLVIAEPLYQLALAGLGTLVGHDRVRWFSDPASDWGRAEAVIDSWSLPCP
jgi:hypothetical protein